MKILFKKHTTIILIDSLEEERFVSLLIEFEGGFELTGVPEKEVPTSAAEVLTTE